MNNNEIITARVTAVHRERYQLLCEKGECYGRLKTKEYYLDQAEFPNGFNTTSYVRRHVAMDSIYQLTVA